MAAGRSDDTSFADDDFNVHPPQNAVYDPRQGDRFNVGHRARCPADFIIIDNDDSPSAQSLRAMSSYSPSARPSPGSNSIQQFDPSWPAIRKAYVERAGRRLRENRRLRLAAGARK